VTGARAVLGAAGLSLLLVVIPVDATEVTAEGLLPGMAVLLINGERVTLRPGQSHGAVRLIEATAQAALIELDGEQRRVAISQRVETSYSAPEERSIAIRRNANMQYVTNAEINGRRVRVLVDTGANSIALNAEQARSLGIRDDEGELAQVQTASEVLPARRVQLRSVNVGGIEASAVDATVMDGEQPSVILLGMSFLRHVQLEERDGVLTLRGRW
jgi:aspartyl protease family protein